MTKQYYLNIQYIPPAKSLGTDLSRWPMISLCKNMRGGIVIQAWTIFGHPKAMKETRLKHCQCMVRTTAKAGDVHSTMQVLDTLIEARHQ